MIKINEEEILFCELSAMVTSCVTDSFRWFYGFFNRPRRGAAAWPLGQAWGGYSVVTFHG